MAVPSLPYTTLAAVSARSTRTPARSSTPLSEYQSWLLRTISSSCDSPASTGESMIRL